MNKIEKLIEKLCPDLPAGRQEGWRNPESLPSEENCWYTYVILCDNGSWYKGFTKNLKKRYLHHLSGNGALHTERHKPLCVLYYETFDTEKKAVLREKYFKSGCGREWLKQRIKEIYNEEKK